MEQLPKNSLLCEYAADIVPSLFCSQLKWKEHIMLYIQGRTSQEEFVLAPVNCSNWGSLLNHSDKANCSTLRVIIDQSVRLILYTTKSIQPGE